jgi:hypothetical protein
MRLKLRACILQLQGRNVYNKFTVCAYFGLRLFFCAYSLQLPSILAVLMRCTTLTIQQKVSKYFQLSISDSIGRVIKHVVGMLKE